MWGTVMAVAVIAAFDPVRIGVALFLISGSRPMRNLVAYWLGAMAASLVAAVGLLTVLRGLAPLLTQHTSTVLDSSATRYLQIGAGIVAVLVALSLLVHQRTRVAVPIGAPSPPVPQYGTPTQLPSRLRFSFGEQDGGRFSWLAFLTGAGSATPPVEYLVVIAVILASGAAFGVQLSAAVLFTLVSLAIIEIPLITCLAKPAQTLAVMERLHNWLRTRRRTIITIAIGVAGVFLLATGMTNA